MNDPTGRNSTCQDPEMAVHGTLGHSMIIMAWQVKAGETGAAGVSQSGSFKTPFFPQASQAFGARPFFILGDCPVHWSHEYLALPLVFTHWMQYFPYFVKTQTVSKYSQMSPQEENELRRRSAVISSWRRRQGHVAQVQ